VSPPLDYSLAAESPAEHIRNALMVLTPRDPSRTPFEWRQDAATVRRLLEAALALLEAQP